MFPVFQPFSLFLKLLRLLLGLGGAKKTLVFRVASFNDMFTTRQGLSAPKSQTAIAATSFARVNSHGHSPERARFSLGIGRMKSQCFFV